MTVAPHAGHRHFIGLVMTMCDGGLCSGLLQGGAYRFFSSGVRGSNGMVESFLCIFLLHVTMVLEPLGLSSTGCSKNDQRREDEWPPRGDANLDGYEE